MSKELKKTEEKKNDETKKIDKHAPEDEISADEANKLRKFLKDETEFRGYDKTAILILKQHKCGMKAQSLANQVRNCFRFQKISTQTVTAVTIITSFTVKESIQFRRHFQKVIS